jgi:hypothetical protein
MVIDPASPGRERTANAAIVRRDIVSFMISVTPYGKISWLSKE